MSWPSNAIRPSLRAMLAISMICSIKSGFLSTPKIMVFMKTLANMPIKSDIFERISSTRIEPPITMAIEVTSIKALIPAALFIAQTMSALAARRPMTVAISILTPSGCLRVDSETNPTCKQSVHKAYTLIEGELSPSKPINGINEVKKCSLLNRQPSRLHRGY